MKKGLGAALAILILAPAAFAHRLDEYLQATLLSIEKDHVDIYLRMVPGVAVVPQVLASIDTNYDGVISEAEAKSYAKTVLRDVSLRADNSTLALQFTSIEFPPLVEMREGTGQIELRLHAALSSGPSTGLLVLENHHQKAISVYLMNCLAPRQKDIRIVRQSRNRNQSWYGVEYVMGSERQAMGAPASVGFASLFRLGIRHIAEGTDHLLFLLALLLPAPLVAVGSRWANPAAIRPALVRILQVVTAFTIGHSITLALAGVGIVRVPARPVEVLIVLSILISAVHAVRPIFPGKEPWVAGFFGLIHGLAFASTIEQLGLSTWQRVISILAFNLGIEAMQLGVVASVLPSLLLMSRSPAYAMLRVGGGVMSGAVALAWTVERLLSIYTPVDAMVGAMAQQGAWMAGGIFILSLICYFHSQNREPLEPARQR